MESFNGPPVRPPNQSDRKKAEGSFVKRNNWLIIIIIVIILIGAGGWFLVNKVSNLKQHYNTTIHLDSTINNDDDNLKVDTGKSNLTSKQDSVFVKPYVATGIARLNIRGGLVNYRLKDTTSQMFVATVRTSHQKYKLESHQEDSVYVIDFSSKSFNRKLSFKDTSDSALIKLNINPTWDISVDAGATDFDFDLSKFKLRSLKLNGGAGQFVVKVGQPLKITNIVVSAGVSDVTINVPQNSACQIQSDTKLSSNTFEGFIKKNGRYETPDFEKAENKIYIQFTGGISDFKVHKY